MNIVDGLKKIAKVSSGCFEHFIIAKIGEKPYEAFAEKVHKVIEWFTTEQRLNNIGTSSVERFALETAAERE